MDIDNTSDKEFITPLSYNDNVHIITEGLYQELSLKSMKIE